jgi:hypothetical protein
MNGPTFSLQQFSPASPSLSLKVTGQIARRSNTLALRYSLLGHLGELLIPAPADIPARKNELWQETCFEFFLAVMDSRPYWEFNFSPAGHWNVYRFAAYRQGMEEEKVFTSMEFSVQRQSESLLLDVEVNLDKIVQENQPLEVGLSALVKIRDGELTYWALTHGRRQADFHRRDSFVVKL